MPEPPVTTPSSGEPIPSAEPTPRDRDHALLELTQDARDAFFEIVVGVGAVVQIVGDGKVEKLERVPLVAACNAIEEGCNRLVAAVRRVKSGLVSHAPVSPPPAPPEGPLPATPRT